MSQTRPLKFSESTLAPDRKAHGYTFLSPACVEAELAFRANIERTDYLSLIPGYAFLRGEYWRDSIAESMRDHGITDESDPKVLESAQRIYFDIYKTKSVEEASSDLHRAKSNVEITMSRIPMFNRALTALLESMVIHTWTAYESMAEVLHIGARREHQNRFPPAALSAEYQFRSERTLIDAYKTAFNDSGITTAAYNSESKPMSVLRHLLVHKRGVVDSGFIRQCAGQDKKGKIIGAVVTDFASYKEGDAIELSGELVRGLIERLAAAGYNLISTVDDWLK